jgi:hypothetical protein
MSQKIPLFDGVMKDITVNFGADYRETVFTPPDVALPDGTRAFYELHLWWSQPPSGSGTGDLRCFVLPQGVAPVSATGVGVVQNSRGVSDPVSPLKILDGYMVRGGTDVVVDIETPAGDQVLFGHYYRVGKGSIGEGARRAIGESVAPDFNAGVPVSFAFGSGKHIIHTFEQGRIDVLSLGAAISNYGVPPDIQVVLTFEDDAGNELGGKWSNGVRNNDDQPLYNLFDEVAFGGSPDQPNLRYLKAEMGPLDPSPLEMVVHGFFTRS